MAFEEAMAQYGALGAMVVFLAGGVTAMFKWITSSLKEEIKQNREVIKNNTIALTKVHEIMTQCNVRR